jgi:hypothetical protein
MASAVVVGFLEDVSVMASPFDDARVGSVSLSSCASLSDFGYGVGECFPLVFRGKVRLSCDMAVYDSQGSHEP